MANKENGYNPSIFDTKYGECFYCGLQVDTARHEVYYGRPNRNKAKRMGFWVNLCPPCHREVHGYPNDGIDLYLKQQGQIKWEKISTREQFIKEWGRSWL